MILPFALTLVTALTGQRGRFTETPVLFVEDKAHGVVCYYIPQEHCIIGDCAYSPAISCVRIDDVPACPELPMHDPPYAVPFTRTCR